MVKLIKLRVIATILCFAFLAPAGFSSSISKEELEPRDSFWLEIDDKKIELSIDNPVEFTAGKNKIKATLRVAPLKEFSICGINLKYPRYFTFEADAKAKDVKMWNLSGAQTILMIQLYDAEMKHEVMAELLQERFGKDNTKVAGCEMSFWGSPKKGTKVITTIGDSSISQEIYSFFNGKQTVMLIIQDSLDEGPDGSEECRNFRKTLQETFKIEN